MYSGGSTSLETQVSSRNHTSTQYHQQAGTRKMTNTNHSSRSTSIAATSSLGMAGGNGQLQGHNLSQFASSSSSFTAPHATQKLHPQNGPDDDNNEEEENNNDSSYTLSSSSSAPATLTAMEQQIRSHKLHITETAANELHETLTKLKDVAKTMLNEMNAYLDETEKVEVEYLKCQESLKKEAKRLNEVEPDIAGTTSFFKFDLN